MYDALTPGALRALERAQLRARANGGSAVEPADLLAALADDAESRAAELMARFELDSRLVLQALGMESVPPESGSDLETPPSDLEEGHNVLLQLPHSAALRAVLLDASMQARSTDRARDVGTEHLLAGLLAESSPAAACLLARGLDLETLRSHLSEQLSTQAAPLVALEGIPPLNLYEPAQAVDLGRILDASANRAREGLRVVEDYVRFVLDDPGLTRRLKEVRHRLGEAVRGLDPELLIGSRDTRGDVGTHIMTSPSRPARTPGPS